MQMNSGIILAGQPVDLMGSVGSGLRNAGMANQLGRENALADLYKTQGAGIMAGDQGALNALAGLDPMAALGVQGQQLGMQAQRQDMAFSAERMQMARTQAARAATEWAQQQDAATVAAERQKLSEGLKGAAYFHAQGNRAGYEAFLAQSGLDPAQYPFDQFPAYAAAAEGALEAWQGFQPKPRQPLSSAGKTKADIDAGLLPPDTPLSGGPQTVVNMGEGPNDGKLRGKLMEKEGELWSSYLQTGATASGTVQDMELLDGLIGMAPQGPVVGRLAEMFPGVSSAGDAFQSIVKRVAPTLRAPGSGATSDIEYDGMLRSLPALRNSPDANRAIAGMMRRKMDLNVQRAQVVSEYQNGAIDAVEARKRITQLDQVSIMTPELEKAMAGLGGQAEQSDGDTQGALTIGTVEDGHVYIGGDPSDRASWVEQR